MSDWTYDEQGIYRCNKCGEAFSPGHSVRCHPTITGDNRLVGKSFDEKLTTGMKMLHSCDENDPDDIGRFLR